LTETGKKAEKEPSNPEQNKGENLERNETENLEGSEKYLKKIGKISEKGLRKIRKK
jgi:hypothetical protein